MKQLQHQAYLIDHFEYMGDIANNLGNEQLPALKKSFKEERVDTVKQRKYKTMQEIKSFMELYQTYTITEYDYWDAKNGPRFSLFVDKFEKDAQRLENLTSQLLLGVAEDTEEGKWRQHP